MVKAPRAGEVKTRLCPPLTRDEAAVLAACLAQDTLSKVGCMSLPLLVAFTPAESQHGLAEMLALDLVSEWFVQRGDHLGERLNNALEDAWSGGYGPLLVLGTDSPTLPASLLQSAFEAMARAEVVLGPCDDGGFFLLGLARPQPGLLEGISWSTSAVLRETLTNCERLGLSVELLPPWYDVDGADDLMRLGQELRARPEQAPRTAAWLESR